MNTGDLKKSTVYKRTGVKTLLDILHEDGEVPRRASLLPDINTIERTPLVRQETISPPIPRDLPIPRFINKKKPYMANNEWLETDIFPGWRVMDLIVDIIVIITVVFPWPWWVGICLVFGMRIPEISRNMN